MPPITGAFLFNHCKNSELFGLLLYHNRQTKLKGSLKSVILHILCTIYYLRLSTHGAPSIPQYHEIQNLPSNLHWQGDQAY